MSILRPGPETLPEVYAEAESAYDRPVPDGVYTGEVVYNYRLLDEIGAGGFGVVYLAEHTELARQVACKILYPEYVRRTEVVERFFREAQAVCAIGHKAIIDIQNYGRLESGEPFFLMEYFDGENLEDYLDRCERVPFDRLEAIFDPVADALAAAHRAGVIHRDLKPANIMVRERDGRIEDVKLLDFGIAKLTADKDASTSQTGMCIGSPKYMAPEQSLDAKNIDQRADIYGFASTLFHAIAGVAAFDRYSLTETIIAVQQEPPPSLCALVPEASPGLEAAMAQCLAKTPDERPATIGDAWQQIKKSLREPPGASAPRPGTEPVGDIHPSGTHKSTAAASTLSTHGSGSFSVIQARTRAPWKWMVLLGLPVVLMLLIVVIVMGQNDSPKGAAVEDSSTAAGSALADGSEAGVADAAPPIEDRPDRAADKPPPKCWTDSLEKQIERAKGNRKLLRALSSQITDCRDQGHLEASTHARLDKLIKRALPRKVSPCSIARFRRIARTGSRAQKKQAHRTLIRRCKPPRLPEDVYVELSKGLRAL